jgi:hypothetical protein
MATEDVRVRLRTKLESAFGAEEASILMDRPPGGWNDLVTNQVLEARLDALQSDLIAEIASVRTEIASVRTEIGDVRSGVRAEFADVRAEVQHELRAQTWKLSALIFVAFGIFAGLVRGL